MQWLVTALRHRGEGERDGCTYRKQRARSADPDGAAARRLVLERGLKDRVDFRNAHYDEVRAALEGYHRQSGGSGAPLLPALWDGERLHEGRDAVLAALAAL